MEKAPGGTTVGVEDPYEHVDRCDFVTDEGDCRWAVEHGDRDPSFAADRRDEAFACPVAADEWDWRDCPHFRCRNRDRECARCGLAEHRMAHTDERPLLEEHHLSYRSDAGRDGARAAGAEGAEGIEGDGGDDATLEHEITVFLCRWCHAKVHRSWAAVDDEVNPDPEAIAEREGRRSRAQSELSFDSAADRFDGDE